MAAWKTTTEKGDDDRTGGTLKEQGKDDRARGDNDKARRLLQDRGMMTEQGADARARRRRQSRENNSALPGAFNFIFPTTL